ncbi:hypothetical protein F2Q69_00059725 [Brassica cretica]|uniref:Uncharacterized protein n=1 Tax=Brassica cretica TaxID=69181 RepID=A0A8S9RQ58_BRACR|nr:hypothetical protein F2Q69_00059725 [Brassica cretica]
MFSKRLDAMKSMVERLPRVAPQIWKSNPDSYADTPFTEEITRIEMPRKFSFTSIKAYDGTSDPDDHVAQYRQRMLAVALPKESREATMWKGFGSTLIGPALQCRSKAQQKQDPKAVRPDRNERDKRPSPRPTKDSGNRSRGRYQNRLIKKVEGMTASTWPDISHLSISKPEMVNVLRQMCQQVKWPQKMKAPNSFWNPWLWCDLHRDHGHKTEDCIALRIEVNELLKKGHLSEFLSEKAKSHLTNETSRKPTETASALPPRQDRSILVDNGSSDNIIFQATYQDLGLEESALTRRKPPLRGFSGEVKQTAREVILPVIRSDLEISDDFGAFWRYLEQAPEMTIELDHRARPSVDIEERISIDDHSRTSIDSEAHKKPIWSQTI